MYRMDLNNWHAKPKNSTIYTPKEVSQFLFELLKDKIPKDQTIFDPCSGMGSLLEPWKRADYDTLGVDIDKNTPADEHLDFLDCDYEDPKFPLYAQELSLVLCNPPFNGYGNKLGSEVWLDKIIEFFGKEVAIVLFVPVGFRVNLTEKSPRYLKLANGTYPAISSIITLPKNIFPDVVFHSEILIFNIPNLQPHYFYHHEN